MSITYSINVRLAALYGYIAYLKSQWWLQTYHIFAYVSCHKEHSGLSYFEINNLVGALFYQLVLHIFLIAGLFILHQFLYSDTTINHDIFFQRSYCLN